jgi:hypothetical protein
MRAEPDQSYFERRSNEELRAAGSASSWLAQEAHRDLAARYAQLAASIAEAEDKLDGRVCGDPLHGKLNRLLIIKQK